MIPKKSLIEKSLLDEFHYYIEYDFPFTALDLIELIVEKCPDMHPISIKHRFNDLMDEYTRLSSL